MTVLNLRLREVMSLAWAHPVSGSVKLRGELIQVTPV